MKKQSFIKQLIFSNKWKSVSCLCQSVIFLSWLQFEPLGFLMFSEYFTCDTGVWSVPPPPPQDVIRFCCNSLPAVKWRCVSGWNVSQRIGYHRTDLPLRVYLFLCIITHAAISVKGIYCRKKKTLNLSWSSCASFSLHPLDLCILMSSCLCHSTNRQRWYSMVCFILLCAGYKDPRICILFEVIMVFK